MSVVAVGVSCNLEPGYSGSGTTKVAVLGDEVTSRSLTELHSALDPGYLVRIGDVSWSAATQVQPVAQSLADGAPDTVVISLGTFDAFDVAPAATTIGALQTMITTFSPTTCVVFVDVYTGVGKAGFDPVKAAEINTGIAAFGKPIVPWNAYVNSNPGAMEGPETIVPTAAGKVAFANMVKTGVANCDSVEIGNPRNYLGTHTMFATEPENMHLAIADYCTGMERGDRIASRADNDGSGATRSCVPGTPAYVKANPEYSPDGYFYAVKFPAPIVGAYKVQFRFGCPSGSNGASNWIGTQRIRFRDKNSNDPLAATVLNTVDLTRTTAGCSTDGTAGNWIDLASVLNPTAGSVYYIQVNPLVPPGTPPGTGITVGGHMHFALRASQPAGFSRCSADASAATTANPHTVDCPKVFALQHMGIRVNYTSGQSFFIASVGAEQAGKQMNVELFDPAEGANAIELIDPNGNPQTIEAEIACKDATYRSETGPCTTGEASPTGGYGPWTATSVDVSGAGTKPFPNLSQDGKYSDRVLRLKFTVPTNYAALYGTKTGWKIRYFAPASFSDRATWTVRITP